MFALYACTGTVPHKPAEEKPAAPAVEAVQPTEPLPPTEIEPIVPEVAELLPEGERVPHIALLLPMQSPGFGPAAEAVQRGFLAAASYGRLQWPVRLYNEQAENGSVYKTYRQAIANGARAVVGPLTRDGVNALAAETNIPVPTLALNVADGEHAPQLYFFGMAIEEEARQIARIAAQQGMRQAIIVGVGTSLSQRLRTAFEEQWSADGRGVLRVIEYSKDPSVFADIGDMTDTMVFLATGAGQARLLRSYLPARAPVYATSQVFSGNTNTLTNYDLNGIRFVDMPWLLQPDHPAVMIYQRAEPPLPIDRERLYALGVDSFRLVLLMLTERVSARMPLDGVSGRIRLQGQTFVREGVQARFIEGRAVAGDADIVPTVQMFPEQQVR
ncbi:MAG TPA: penicillin-binding protein activator [Gallionella sp.]